MHIHDTVATRAARPADLMVIRQMIRALCAYHGDEVQMPLAKLQDIFFGPNSHAKAYLAFQADTPLGYLGLLHSPAIHHRTRWVIDHLYVVQTHRSCGVGKALIAVATKAAREMGCDHLSIAARADNKQAVAAYRAMGLIERENSSCRFQVPLREGTPP